MNPTQSPEQIPTYTPADLNQIVSRTDRYFKEGMDSYSEHVIAEERSKKMYLALLLMGASNGMAGIDLGVPGTSKSLMMKVGPRIIDGIDVGDIAKVPHRIDLQPAQLVGEESEVVRKGERDNKPFREEMTQILKAILRPGSKAIILDEITRTSPYALNAALEIIQEGKIAVSHNGIESELSTEDIDLIIAASNNHGTAFTSKLDPAIIGRFGMGTFTGVRPEDFNQASEVKETMWNNHDKQYGIVDHIETVATRDELHVMRNAIPHIHMRKQEIEYGIKLTNRMLREMEGKGVNMGDGRSDQQIIRAAKALAMLDNSTKVEQEHIYEASRYFATAKLGLLPKMTEAEIDKFVASVDAA